MSDILINFGGEIKAQADGKLSGYLVRFSSEADPDLVGDFFTKSTDFGIEDGAKTPIYLHHRQPLETKGGKKVIVKQKIGEGTLKLDDDGILIEAILFEREKYEKALASMGWSSGTAAHLIDRERRGKAFEIKLWPLGQDASLTPRPCEPRNVAYLKSVGDIELEALELELSGYEIKGAVGSFTTEGDYIHYRIKDPADFEDKSFRTITIKKDKPVIKAVVGKLKGESSTTLQNLMFATSDWSMAEAKKWVKDHPDVKKSFDLKVIDGQALFNDSLRQREQQTWDLWSAVQTGARKIADAASATDVTGVEVNITEAVSALVGAYSPKLITAIVTQIEDYLNSDHSNEPFYLKSNLLDAFIASSHALVSDALLEDHSTAVVSAVEEFATQAEAVNVPLKAWLTRLGDKQEFRVKSGRVISQANKEKMNTVHGRIGELMSLMKEMQTSLSELMSMAEPKKAAPLEFQIMIAEHLNWQATGR